jgi:hypothetical protein
VSPIVYDSSCFTPQKNRCPIPFRTIFSPKFKQIFEIYTRQASLSLKKTLSSRQGGDKEPASGALIAGYLKVMGNPPGDQK